MKNISWIALLPLLSLIQPAGAESGITALEKRCSEQERQIIQLEEENGRLRSLLESASKMETQKMAPEAQAELNPPTSSQRTDYYTVAQGDNLSRIARKNDTTPEELAKLNNLKDAGLIRPGQKLKLPQTALAIARNPSTKVSEVVASTPSNRAGTHTVKAGETFFGIARKYGLSIDTLTAANPKVNPRSLRIGQSLQLVPGNVAQDVPNTASAPKPDPVLSPTNQSSSKPVSNQPRIRSIRIDKEITFGDFAVVHGMEPAKLNALNGLHLESNTVLAKGSELYVSAQP